MLSRQFLTSAVVSVPSVLMPKRRPCPYGNSGATTPTSPERTGYCCTAAPASGSGLARSSGGTSASSADPERLASACTVKPPAAAAASFCSRRRRALLSSSIPSAELRDRLLEARLAVGRVRVVGDVARRECAQLCEPIRGLRMRLQQKRERRVALIHRLQRLQHRDEPVGVVARALRELHAAAIGFQLVVARKP